MFDFKVVTEWIDEGLRNLLPASLVNITECVLIGICLLVAYALFALALPHRNMPVGGIRTLCACIDLCRTKSMCRISMPIRTEPRWSLGNHTSGLRYDKNVDKRNY